MIKESKSICFDEFANAVFFAGVGISISSISAFFYYFVFSVEDAYIDRMWVLFATILCVLWGIPYLKGLLNMDSFGLPNSFKKICNKLLEIGTWINKKAFPRISLAIFVVLNILNLLLK